jgi:hypothetical protein
LSLDKKKEIPLEMGQQSGLTIFIGTILLVIKERAKVHKRKYNSRMVLIIAALYLERFFLMRLSMAQLSP